MPAMRIVRRGPEIAWPFQFTGDGEALGCKVENVLPCSTGVIGVELDPELLTDSAAPLAASFLRSL